MATNAGSSSVSLEAAFLSRQGLDYKALANANMMAAPQLSQGEVFTQSSDVFATAAGAVFDYGTVGPLFKMMLDCPSVRKGLIAMMTCIFQGGKELKQKNKGKYITCSWAITSEERAVLVRANPGQVFPSEFKFYLNFPTDGTQLSPLQITTERFKCLIHPLCVEQFMASNNLGSINEAIGYGDLVRLCVAFTKKYLTSSGGELILATPEIMAGIKSDITLMADAKRVRWEAVHQIWMQLRNVEIQMADTASAAWSINAMFGGGVTQKELNPIALQEDGAIGLWALIAASMSDAHNFMSQRSQPLNQQANYTTNFVSDYRQKINSHGFGISDDIGKHLTPIAAEIIIFVKKGGKASAADSEYLNSLMARAQGLMARR